MGSHVSIVNNIPLLLTAVCVSLRGGADNHCATFNCPANKYDYENCVPVNETFTPDKTWALSLPLHSEGRIEDVMHCYKSWSLVVTSGATAGSTKSIR
jgi:hypothetical protein